MSPGILHIIGAGLAGSEAAFAAAEAGIRVVLHEMRPRHLTPAHQTGLCAELVCSNSFRSDDWAHNAVGLLHAELRAAGSLVMAAADRAQVSAGAALAVDRTAFSESVTSVLRAHPLVEFRAEMVPDLPDPDSGTGEWHQIILATGPLTAPGLAAAIAARTGAEQLAFFDAIAPIIYRESIDFSVAFMQSRYDKEGPGGDNAAYVNCPMDEAQYRRFHEALLAGEQTQFREWERDTPFFEGCLPIEVMAARGLDTLRFGPMKPVGLMDPRTGTRSHAVVQLRQDNALGTLWNMVGFQTKLKHSAQADIFRLIPGLEAASFARLGGIHRNMFIESPRLLDTQLRLKSEPRLRFAGQITGVEGYVESAAMGLLAGRFAAAELLGADLAPPPATTAMGALLSHVTGGHLANGKGSFQPMNVNFGLFPPIEFPPIGAPIRDADGKRLRGEAKGQARKRALAERALADFRAWNSGWGQVPAANVLVASPT